MRRCICSTQQFVQLIWIFFVAGASVHMFIHTISTLVGSVWYATIVYLTLVCYTAVFSVVTQRSPPGGRHDTKNGCVAD